MVRPLAHGARLVTVLILEKVKPILQATVYHALLPNFRAMSNASLAASSLGPSHTGTV
jgi:hypothetical protein